MSFYVMGRRMFGGGEGTWARVVGRGSAVPPAPVFVLSDHERAPLEMAGGTTFFFVTGGIGEALDGARAATG